MLKKINRVIWIVMDSVGMGEARDAEQFGDVGSNTIGNIVKARGHIELPTLRSIGYGNIDGMKGVMPIEKPSGAYVRLEELSAGKDTTTGHWEMIGIHTKTPFPTYPNGFPKEIIDEFCKECGFTGVFGNCVASGTKIIEEMGEEQMRTGNPIVYTSADSVFQIAAHEDIIPPERLWEICRIARRILKGEHEVGRVIARPFVGSKGSFKRTTNRRDFSKIPDKNNLLTKLKNAGYPVAGVGKIEDIFAGEGITDALHTKSNLDGMRVTHEYMDKYEKGLIFTNLVEFDSTWGHRRDVEGYAKGLEEFDTELKQLIDKMTQEDLLIITADHGCDPTFKGTDHTREYVPGLLYQKGMKDINLHDKLSFACLGQTVADIFQVEPLAIGESLLPFMMQ